MILMGHLDLPAICLETITYPSLHSLERKNKDKTVIKYPLGDCSSATYPTDTDLIARGSGYGLKGLSKSSMATGRVPGIMLILQLC
jgi:hypothetical protein